MSPREAKYYEKSTFGTGVRCLLCPHNCRLKNSGIGRCGARRNRSGTLYSQTYGQVTSSNYDPIEKKPLYHYHPGGLIYSIGTWGCNLKCVFCQNSSISQYEATAVPLSPNEIAKQALERGSIGAAYTYNEPIVSIEYVMDCARAVRKAGGKNVLVSNAFVNPEPFEDLLPLMDAMNLDIKAFNEDFYGRMCGGSLDPVLETVKAAAGRTHLELTTLIIPEENDAIPELEDLSAWIAENCGEETPCHLTAYHPSYNYDQGATTAAHLKNARFIFKKRLHNVYIGNVLVPGAGDTQCAACGSVVVGRNGYAVDRTGMNADGTCAKCGADNNIIVA